MSGIVSNLVNRLIGAGVDPGEAAEIIALAMLVGVSNAPKDTAAEKRRAWDRQRKRVKSGGNPPDSTGNHRNTVEADKKVSPKPLSKNSPPSDPLGGPHGSAQNDFEAAWRAYPHVRGRSSKAKAAANYRKLTAEHRAAMAAAAARYAVEGREPKAECGAPAFDRWLRDGRYVDWLPGPDPPPRQLTPELHARLVQRYRDTGEWNPAYGPKPAEAA